MPPYQQNYQETFEIESKNKPRDINILNQIFKNRYRIFPTEDELFQYNDCDMVARSLEKPFDTRYTYYIDRKTSKKKAREWFIFEPYIQYPPKEKFKSWSLHIPAGGSTILDKFLIAFLDEEQAVIVRRDKMIPIIELIEKERPDLIKIHEEFNETGKRNIKYIIPLPRNHKYLKMMNPIIFKMDRRGCFIKQNNF
ncbi:MAG: hypothetical protein ACLSWP_12925 [Terrisporobacter sp.]|jgi:hypothetical protein|uniref:hypothetical protein n=1 Tax=Terrisporobacter sp. TaxID=1965305 RepID=UPI00399186D2